MTYTITLTIPLKGRQSKGSAEDVAMNAIEHLAETFNDDNSLDIEHTTASVQKRVSHA